MSLKTLDRLRVIRAQILRDWKIKSKGFDIEVELNASSETGIRHSGNSHKISTKNG
jgi:hypothetical protein